MNEGEYTIYWMQEMNLGVEVAIAESSSSTGISPTPSIPFPDGFTGIKTVRSR